MNSRLNSKTAKFSRILIKMKTDSLRLQGLRRSSRNTVQYYNGEIGNPTNDLLHFCNWFKQHRKWNTKTFKSQWISWVDSVFSTIARGKRKWTNWTRNSADWVHWTDWRQSEWKKRCHYLPCLLKLCWNQSFPLNSLFHCKLVLSTWSLRNDLLLRISPLFILYIRFEYV